MPLKSFFNNFYFLFLFFLGLAFIVYFLNIDGKLVAGLFTFIAILLAFSINRSKHENVRDIGSLNLDKGNKINIWTDSINYRYKKTAIKFLSLSKVYGIKVWENNSFKNINYFSNKSLQNQLKPKLYPKNYKIDIWGNVFNKK
tara:strand:- start:208 stop:636 length:429 start_codon:yes stop_codon:yes gene_type:complete